MTEEVHHLVLYKRTPRDKLSQIAVFYADKGPVSLQGFLLHPLQILAGNSIKQALLG